MRCTPVILGPLVHPSFKTAMADRRKVLDPINPRVAQRFLALYTGNDDIDDPRLSLLHASAGGLPPIQMHYGTLEVMRAEAELFAARVTEAGGPCVQRVWPNLLYGYWLFPQFVPEAWASLHSAGRFVHDAVRTDDWEAAAVEGIERARGSAAAVSGPR